MALREYTWCLDAGASRQTSFTVQAVQFGDGYKQVSDSGINNVRDSASYSTTGKLAEVSQAYNFLREHKGVTPFIINVGGVTGVFRTVNEVTRTHIKADRWQVSFTVEEVFIP